MELREGMQVKVVKVPPNESDYPESLIGSVGTCTTDALEGWVYVKFNHDDLPLEFKVEELAPYNVTVIEGEADRQHIGGVYIGNEWLGKHFQIGKHYRITIEEVQP